ncbi:MAG: GDPmannose 4,6-dehydratase [Candidatus Peregrinibacteria bacterium Greene1014_49]|nr:MAG: GDPmannose 4,6-dehydratase [Candidatus Peregrinibacteria bacterium Greene1014_49]
MPKKKAIITGITGQDGSYLAELLIQKDYEIHGVVRRASTFNRGRIDHLNSDESNPDCLVHLHYGDLGDSNSLLRIIHDVKPDEIYNLAAQSHVGVSFEMPEYTGDITALGTTRLLEALRTSKLPAKFYQASSSELYGKTTSERQDEETPFYPRSPYGCAKAYAYYLTRNYRESYGMYAVNGILFNHESPRRGENFEAKRDWGYAPEFVEGMWKMLQCPEPEDYVLATGRTASVREFLELCMKHLHINYERKGSGKDETYTDTKTGKKIVALDPLYNRPAEVDFLLGDASKAKKKLGWEAKTSIEELAKIMLEADCRKQGVQLN